jgi:hypothetical protein
VGGILSGSGAVNRFSGPKTARQENNQAHDYSRRIEKYFTARHGIASMTAGK